MNFLGCYISKAAAKNYKIFGMELVQRTYRFLVMAQNLSFVTILEKSTKHISFFSHDLKILSQIELIPSPVIKFCDAYLAV